MNEREQQAMMELRLKLAQHQILEESQIEATKQKILASSSPEVLASMEGLSDTEKALKCADAYFAAMTGKTEAPSADPSKSKKSTAPQLNMTAEDTNAIQQYLDENAEATNARTSRTRVICQLTDKPVLAAVHVSGAKLIPSVGEKAEANFAKWESMLVDTPENKQKFQEMKTAFMKKEPMEVFINPDAREKVIGWKIETIDENNQPITQILNKDDAIAFLLIKVQGVIPNRDANSIGLAIRWSESKRNKAKDNENGGGSKGVTSISVKNRKALSENKDLSVCTCAIISQGGQKVINDQYNAKTAAYFEINTGKKNMKGEVICRKIRLSGKTQAYRVERKEEFMSKFSNAEGSKTGKMTTKEKSAIQNARVNALYSLQSNDNLGNAEVRQAIAMIRKNKATFGGNFH